MIRLPKPKCANEIANFLGLKNIVVMWGYWHPREGWETVRIFTGVDCMEKDFQTLQQANDGSYYGLPVRPHAFNVPHWAQVYARIVEVK